MIGRKIVKSSEGCAHGLMQTQNPWKNFLDSKPILSITLADLAELNHMLGCRLSVSYVITVDPSSNSLSRHHFIDERTEAQRGQITHPTLRSETES